MGLPDPVIELLKQHHAQQAKEAEVACELWTDTGFVFTTRRGQPINPSTDYHEWKRLLGRAEVPERRLHDARHTAATVLLLLGVPERTVMAIMGWSSTAMAARYQHVIASIRRDVAQQIGGLLWKPPIEGRTTGEEPSADGATPAA